MSVVSKTKLLQKLSKKAYRDAYAEESVKTSLPFQIKAMREQRNWSQIVLGNKSSMKQNAISRLESAEYGTLNINTLIRLANAFDCGLLVKFVPFSRLVKEFEDVSPNALEVKSFEDDLETLKTWSDNDILNSSILTTDGKFSDNESQENNADIEVSSASNVLKFPNMDLPTTFNNSRLEPFQSKLRLEEAKSKTVSSTSLRNTLLSDESVLKNSSDILNESELKKAA